MSPFLHVLIYYSLGTGKLWPEEEGKQARVVVGSYRHRGSKSDAAREETRFLTRNSNPKSSGLRWLLGPRIHKSGYRRYLPTGAGTQQALPGFPAALGLEKGCKLQGPRHLPLLVGSEGACPDHCPTPRALGPSPLKGRSGEGSVASWWWVGAQKPKIRASFCLGGATCKARGVTYPSPPPLTLVLRPKREAGSALKASREMSGPGAPKSAYPRSLEQASDGDHGSQVGWPAGH